MENTRREFIKTSAAATLCAVAGCSRRPEDRDLDMEADGLVWHKSVCRFCGTGCGVKLGVSNDRLVALRGDADHPTTKGLVCAKALFLPEILYSPDRLKTPKVRRDGKMVEVSWDEAMSLVAKRFAEDIGQHGPDSVAYYGSGQCLSEESYLANRLFKGGIGTNNVEGNPRLCMASAVGGYVTTYGKDEPMGCYDDIEHARVFFLVGSNTAEAHPVIFDQILLNRQQGRIAKVILLDPRKTPVRNVTDVHLAPRPGYDLAVFHAMAHVIVREGLHHKAFVAKNVKFSRVVDGETVDVSFDDYVAFLEDFSPEKVEQIADVPADAIEEAARLFAKYPTVSFWTMGLNQRTTGVWANNLVHNLHLLTGAIGKKGQTPFSLTGQPNACGGVRDTGTLCHILPYGRLVAKEPHRAEIEELWGCPGRIQPKPGLNTIEMFKALAANKIRSMLVLTTNPGHSLPNLNVYRDAMGKPRADKPFIVVVDGYPTKTTELADVVLPAAIWSEKEGVFGMSERRYQFLPKLVDPPGSARSDFDVLLELAARLEKAGVVPEGFISAKFKNQADVWQEMMEASRGTAYDFTGMTRDRLKKEPGIRWPCPSEDHPGTARRYVKGEDPLLDEGGPFADDSLEPGDISFYGRPDKRAVIWLRPMKPPAEPTDDEFPFVLSTGRVLEHWHTGTMTMKATQLRRAQPEAFMEIHPADAKKLDIASGDMVRITSRRGESVIKARVIDTPREGMVFVPFHWSDPDSLINNVTIDAYDPGSKQPEFKICAVKLAKA